MLITSSHDGVFFLKLYYFCTMYNPNCLTMKKIVFVAITFLALCLAGCNDKKVTTQYTIGCLGYQYGSIQGSDWEELEAYFKSHVAFNELVTYEGKSLAENDAQARQYFDEQMSKIDPEYICSLLHSSDFFIYGIATINAGGSYRIIKAMQVQENGMHETK